MAVYSFETYGELQPWIGREWLQTNGTGAFSSSTVVGANTRRYHGLLVGATLPPVGRIVALSRINESVHREGSSIELGVAQFRDVIVPHGEQFLGRFQHGISTRFEYDAEDVHVAKEVLLCHGRNVVGVRYEINPGIAAAAVEFRLQPFVGLRDFHSLLRADASMETRPLPSGCVVRRYGNELFMRCDGTRFVAQGDWWYNFNYAIETERGQDDTEDLFVPGHFAISVTEPTAVVFWAGLEPVDRFDWDTECAKRQQNTPGQSAPSRTQQRLIASADDFVVGRPSADDPNGKTILAGYPWFSDWGRDTMIALPGLLLSTGRFDEAGRVLCSFAKFVSEGMIPNVFDDYSNQPHYNTVDASLWFVHAVFEYLKRSRDNETFESILRPACAEIIDGYRRGTRFGIKMDANDALISQGDPSSQLTWMDAKTNGVVFTPRHGKAVEINALWYHDLVLMGEDELAKQAADSFRRTFWISPHRGLADVVNETGRDEACRPNQIFAVSLTNSPLSDEQQKAVVEVVRRDLLTPYGLRTLSAGHPKYSTRYTGSQFERDAAYHNGTIWPWPIGAFLEAFLRVNRRSRASVEQARRWLQPLIDALEDGCIGSIAEIYEAQPPHRSLGACAQAWSVSEVLRLAIELEM
ncbi:MAG: glycogen debranching enzyme family protein [Burkholderiales bacterium]|nr:glycogen debranching enzyme family protein [Phycisphaerae bacterium]